MEFQYRKKTVTVVDVFKCESCNGRRVKCYTDDYGSLRSVSCSACRGAGFKEDLVLSTINESKRRGSTYLKDIKFKKTRRTAKKRSGGSARWGGFVV